MSDINIPRHSNSFRIHDVCPNSAHDFYEFSKLHVLTKYAVRKNHSDFCILGVASKMMPFDLVKLITSPKLYDELLQVCYQMAKQYSLHPLAEQYFGLLSSHSQSHREPVTSCAAS